MFLEYTRCCYTLMRQMYERPKLKQVTFLYYLDWVIYIYAFRYYYIALLGYSGFPSLSHLDWRLDPICLFFYRYRHTYDSFIPVIIFLLVSFHIFMRYLMYNLNVNTLTWQWWYALLVENQNFYYASFINHKKFASLWLQKKEETLALLRKNSLSRMLPNFVLIPFSKLLARFLLFIHLDHLNKGQFLNSKLTVLPGLSDKLRIRVLFTAILADKVLFFVQLLPSKLILSFIFN